MATVEDYETGQANPCAVTASRTTRPWSHGGAYCPAHDHHEIALICTPHRFENVYPQPHMLDHPEALSCRSEQVHGVANSYMRSGHMPQPPDRSQREPRPTESPMRTWQDMREWCARILLTRTNEDVDAWNRRIAAAALDDEQALRTWLDERGVTGYAQALLVWERLGYPDFLTADADALVAAQYADRPRLRPVLDAVLAALPALGPVTVQARKTYVSLVSPRRTFAVVQATTKSRVDLALRLSDVEPGGRLHAARNIGNGGTNLRIPLTTPDELDDEAFGWLRRAYDESCAPPPPRGRSAPRPASTSASLAVVIEGTELPGLSCRPEPGGTGHHAVHVALYTRGKDQGELLVPGRPWRVIDPVPGDAPSARWELDITVRRGTDGSLDFAGPFVRGDRTDRHLGLAWGDVPGDGTLLMFRGAKLRLVDIDPDIIANAARPGHRLVARVRLTNSKGLPICARVRPPDIVWSAEPVDAGNPRTAGTQPQHRS